MKSRLSVVTLALIAALCSCTGPKDVRVLYWNIQNGMWADQGNNYDNFVSFVKETEPDICIWCEAKSHYRTGSGEPWGRVGGCPYPGWRYKHSHGAYLAAEIWL